MSKCIDSSNFSTEKCKDCSKYLLCMTCDKLLFVKKTEDKCIASINSMELICNDLLHHIEGEFNGK